MAVTIDEVSAEVAPSERTAPAAPQAAPKPSPAAERRRICEHVERLQQRAARVRAD